ncbi:MAG: hypothetical protein ACREP1_02650 [Rhodanobacteraceae bacterium]
MPRGVDPAHYFSGSDADTHFALHHEGETTKHFLLLDRAGAGAGAGQSGADARGQFFVTSHGLD